MNPVRNTLGLIAVTLLLIVEHGNSNSVPGTQLSCHGDSELCNLSIDAIGCCSKDTHTCQPLKTLPTDTNYNGRCVPTGRSDLVDTYTGTCHKKFEPCRNPETLCCNRNNVAGAACPLPQQGLVYSQCPEPR